MEIKTFIVNITPEKKIALTPAQIVQLRDNLNKLIEGDYFDNDTKLENPFVSALQKEKEWKKFYESL